MSDPVNHPPVSAVLSGLAGRCPCCGKGKLFQGFLTLAPRCETCGLDFSFADSADGPAFFVSFGAGFIVVFAALMVEIAYQPPFWVHAALWLPLILITTIAPLRPIKGLLIAQQYRHRAAEGRLASRPERDESRRTGTLVPGIIALAGIAVLIGLGTWQLERKSWKENLIATLEQRLAVPATPLPPPAQWASLTQAKDEFRRVSLRAVFPLEGEGRVYASGSGLREDIKGPGYFAFSPARVDGGSVVVVNRGYVANPSPDASLRPIAVTGGVVDIIGVLRWPELRGWFVSDHTARDDLWFARDHRAMAAQYGWGDVAPFYIEQEAPTPAGGLPKPGTLKINLRNEHLHYALTWYGLAAVLAVVFVLWARGRRRASLRIAGSGERMS